MKAAVLALAALAACVSSDAVTCSDGKLCPAGSKCVALTNPNPQATDPSPELCATPQQLSVCVGVGDGVACTDDSGTCYGGLCISPKGCGNGWLDPNEVCDDGNQTSGDGCAADCKSLETCGNHIVDAVKNEECDDGNNIDHDGCDSTCHFEVANWTEIAIDQITALDAPSLAYDENHGVAVLFGGDAGAAISDLTWLSNGNGWARANPASAPRARNRAAMAYDSHRGRIVLFGGGDVLDFADTWEWDGTSWTPIETPVAPAPRAGAAMAYDAHRQRIVLYGGIPAFGQGDSEGLNGNAFGDTWEWDGKTWTKTIASSAVVGGRGFPAMAYDPVRGKVVMFGGNDGGAGLASPDVFEYDGAAWTDVAVSGPTARWGATMAWDPSSQAIVLFGGTPDGSTPDADTWLWSGTSWAQYTSATAPTARFVAAMTTDPLHGRAILFGGYGDDPPTTWAFSNHAWTELTPIAPTGLRAEQVALDTDRGRAVIYDADDSLTWECDGTSWTSTPNVPVPQHDTPGIAYDSGHHKTVLFGGLESGTEVNDTWQWNGTAWTQAFPATSPSPRAVPLVYDQARQQVVAFGGSAAGTALDETWVWDGTTWKQLSPATKPPARLAHAVAYDPVRAQVVVFGGADSGSSLFGDTWTWDGTTWTQQHPTFSPNAQADATMVWNASRTKLELFDGVTNDIWEWDGKDWNVLAPAQRPPLRVGALVFPTSDETGIIMMNGFAPVPPPSFPRAFSDVWRFRFQGTSPAEACQLDVDVDGDGLKGCADADCWFACTPDCPPAASCPASAPKCGDGTCNAALESCRNCPADCGACTAACGDNFCDAPETATTCPGDCP